MQKPQQDVKKAPVALAFSKEMWADDNRPRRIQQIKFGLQAPEEIVRCGVLHVYERSLYTVPGRAPYQNGVLDRRLGVSNKTAQCETCHQKLADCAGHFGYIWLELPVFHIGYFKNTLQILQCICKCCSRILMPDAARQAWLRRFRNPRVERVQRNMMFKKVIDLCKRQRLCPWCGNFNGVVKKATGSLKLVHERYDKKKAAALHQQYMDLVMAEAAESNEALAPHLSRVADDLHPLRVRALFEAITDEDCVVLDLGGTRPEQLVVRAVAVPPVAIRPSVEMDGASNEDDITMKLMQIIDVNAVLRQGLQKGLPISNLMESWDFLQASALQPSSRAHGIAYYTAHVQCAMLINSDVPGLPQALQTPGRPTRGFVQRLKGKQGRFRGNLSGKRVDFSGRTVISPDPNLAIHQVCVPQHMAVVLTYPERVTAHNLDKLRQRVIAGTHSWPGASFVVMPNGDKIFLKYGDRRRIANDLKEGCIVERHLDDGDVVLFNRQPSLHRISIMAFKAKVRPWRTLRFNECCCSPFNADFDGDEMNLHLPQTEEARAEAFHLMGSVSNLATPKNGDIMICATQDFLTCAFLVTAKDAFYSRDEISLLAAYMSDATVVVDLPPPAIIKPLQLWTGKQLFSLIIRPNAATRVFVNLEMAEKIYVKGETHMCPNDGYICFRNSELLCGRIGKGILGGSKGGLFGTLNSDYGPQVAAVCMSRLAKMAARHMGNRGFTIGIDDVTPRPLLLDQKASIISKSYAECDDYLAAYRKGHLVLQPGCNLDQSLESLMTATLNGIRDSAGGVCMKTLHYHNSPLIMSQCGSKGSPINIAQMVACVGQQSVAGKRAFNGFTDRTLPHFPRGDKTAAGKGFVANSFFSGLSATEFWFHTMGGREGLVDTAVKTAETGYMSRRLMKALEDLYVHYDCSVRNAARGIVQFTYGDDGMDPVVMEGKDGLPLDFESLLAKVRATTQRLPRSAGGDHEVPLPAPLRALVAQQLTRPQFADPEGVAVPGSAAAQPTSPAPAEASASAANKSTPGLIPASTRTAAGVLKGLFPPTLPGQISVKHEPGGRAGGSRPGRNSSHAPAPFIDGPAIIKAAWCSDNFRAGLRDFLDKQVASYVAARNQLGLEEGARGPPEFEYLAGLRGITPRQLVAFMDRAIAKYERKRIDPGSTVGAVGAQSIGEPGTQMTLKTFHFAGVASMNVTLGVPRIKEIINAAKKISTPIMKVMLNIDGEDIYARAVKGLLEKTLLGQVARYIKLKLRPFRAGAEGDAHIVVALDMEHLQALRLDNINATHVRDSILAHPRTKLKDGHVKVVREDKLVVLPPDPSRQQLMFQLETLMGILPKVLVAGISTVERAVISEETAKGSNKKTYQLLVEGTDLRRVLATWGVDWRRTETNHVAEIERCLGIEAARTKIIKEIRYTMGSHGMSIDDRHTMLLADCMTYKGEVLGITRFGIAKMKDSVLHSASFEKTADHLFDAAIHNRVDDVVGVSESIIMGIPMATGTGLFKLHVNDPDEDQRPQKRSLQPGRSSTASTAAASSAAAAGAGPTSLIKLPPRGEPLFA